MELDMERAPSVFARDDTFFGVCEALGEDLRIPSTLLRIGFALALFVNPIAAVATYFGLGLLVMALRWFVPTPTVELPAEAEEGAAAAPAEARAEVAEDEEEGLPIAA